MNYISTRTENSVPKSGAYVIKKGLAPDGGLFLPESIPVLTESDFGMLLHSNYVKRAAYLLGLFLDDYTDAELLSAAKAAYGKNKFPDEPAPCAKVGERFFLELWHGPTSAFKDMALQIMPRLLSLSLEKTGEKRDAYILVATSGDTGKAALEGYCDVPRTRIKVFYPVKGVSHIQKMQMASQKGKNVDVVAINGNFDDAQNGVKAVFSDEACAASVAEKGLFFSSANSINWGRLAPQIVYYVSAYCDLVNAKQLKWGELLDVAVPTGNFGNILACFFAKKMGLPVGKIICASNRNNILTDFLNTGIYDKRRDFYTTSSPSMDILISSNLERLLYLICGAEETRRCMRSLSENGHYSVSAGALEKIRGDFVGLCCGEDETAETIKRYFEKFGYLADTHTAVAAYAADKYNSENKTLVVSTASPYKFAPAVLSALGQKVPDDDFAAIDALNAYTRVPVPRNLASLKNESARFTRVIEPQAIAEEAICPFASV